jgi:hypothetical protein
MMDTNNSVDSKSAEPGDELLRQLLHLKRYETPDTARMVKNKQNIMRQVRVGSSKKGWTLADLLEVNIPWFFAEPRYGIAALFVVFATLQFWGVNAQKQVNGENEMYVPQSVVVTEPSASTYSDSIAYPKLPEDLLLFPNQQGDSSVKFVGRIESE